MSEQDTIKRRADGSIDTAFYMNRGRQLRSEQAFEMARNGQNLCREETARVVTAARRMISLRAWFAGKSMRTN